MLRVLAREEGVIHRLFFRARARRSVYPGLLAVLFLGATETRAQETSVLPVSRGEALPPAVIEGLEMRPFVPLEFSRAWLAKADAVRRRRAELRVAGRLEGVSPERLASDGAALAGRLRIPVIAVRYQDVPAPYPIMSLAERLFGASRGDTLSLTDYWSEVSGGLLRVEGIVTSWIPLRRSARHYLPRYEYGWGRFGRIADLRRHVLEAVDPGLDFARFDNDGPDGLPDSGDDDGFVDFVAFFYATDCALDPREGSIWPHRGAMPPFETNDPAAGGGRIRIADYVILPAQDPRDCGPAHIGVLAHEVAHGFGLPDLYDYDGSSRGVGSWGLMGTGSHASAHSPAHPGAWVKEQLGWARIDPLPLSTPLSLPPVQADGPVLRHDLDDGTGRYLLLENRADRGSDRDLPGHGLLVWAVDPERVELGVWNGDERRPAVALLAADSAGELVTVDGLDAHGPFPGRPGLAPAGDRLPVRVATQGADAELRIELRPTGRRRWGVGGVRLATVPGGSRQRVSLREGLGGAGGWVVRASAPWIRLERRGESLLLETDPLGLQPGSYSDTLDLVDEQTGRVSDRLPVRLDVNAPGRWSTVAEDLPWGWGLALVDGRLVEAGYGWDPLGLRPRPRLLEVDAREAFPRTLTRIPAEALYAPVSGPGGEAFVLAHARGQNFVYRVDGDRTEVVAAGVGEEPAYGLAALPDGSLLVAGWSGRIRRVDADGAVTAWADLARPVYQLAADRRGAVYAALLSGQVLRVRGMEVRALETGFDRGRLVAVATSPDGRAFAAERGGGGRLVELTPTGPRLIARVPGAEFYGVAADALFLYGLDLAHRRIVRVAIGHPGARALAGAAPASADGR